MLNHARFRERELRVPGPEHGNVPWLAPTHFLTHSSLDVTCCCTHGRARSAPCDSWGPHGTIKALREIGTVRIGELQRSARIGETRYGAPVEQIGRGVYAV